MQDVIEWAAIIIIWVGLAALTGWIAQRKGRRFTDWFGAGLLLGMFGVPFVLFASRGYLAGIEQRHIELRSRKPRLFG